MRARACRAVPMWYRPRDTAPTLADLGIDKKTSADLKSRQPSSTRRNSACAASSSANADSRQRHGQRVTLQRRLGRVTEHFLGFLHARNGALPAVEHLAIRRH